MKTQLSDLAINGGPKTKTTPYGKGQRYEGNERKYLDEALASNTLFYGFGKWVKRACEMMVNYTGMPYVVSCSSGSAAIHLGMIAAGIGPGDEVILTPNTDTGSVIGIIEEGAVPVFCDCDWTLQPTAATVAAKITPLTRAVLVIHLAGHPAPVDEIVALCKPRGIAVVEDCAQSWGTKLNGKQVGSFGTAGCFSTNDFKHISTGDGGFVALNDPEIYRRVSNYSDKHYDRLFGGSRGKAHFGMNYRMSELQGAVAVAQLEKVDTITARHNAVGERLRSKLQGLPGARVLAPIPGGYATCWWSVLWVDEPAVTATRDQLVSALIAEGVGVYGYGQYDLINSPMFQTRLVRPWLTDGRQHYPFVQPDGRSYTYSLESTPVHKRMLATGIGISIGGYYTEQDVDETAAAIWKVFSAYAK